jgi:hypothetical protein
MVRAVLGVAQTAELLLDADSPAVLILAAYLENRGCLASKGHLTAVNLPDFEALPGEWRHVGQTKTQARRGFAAWVGDEEGLLGQDSNL